MKLWILRPVRPLKEDPWDPWYDKCFGFVIRADSEEEAREEAEKKGGDETRYGREPWLDARYSTCEELSEVGDPEMVIQDFHAA